MSDGDEMTRAEQLAVAHTDQAAWRVGRKIPRNLYAGNLDVGRLDTADLAETVVRAVNGVAALRALHTPEKRWQDSVDSTLSWDTEQEALDWGDGETATYFEVCEHCGDIEMRLAGSEGDYLDALWPCATIRALDGDA